MLKARSLFAHCVIAIFLVGCCGNTEPYDEDIYDVERVLMNDTRCYGSCYTLVTSSANLLVPKKYCAEKATLIQDVPPEKKVWAKYHGYRKHSVNDLTGTTLEIHLHSPKDIGGGEEDQGKFGTHRIVPIE